MHLATSSCNPACQERRSITAFLHGAVPRRFVTAGFKLAYAKSTQRSLSADTGTSASQIRCCSDPGFGDFYVKSTSLYGLVRILPTSFSKALRTPHFLRFFFVKSNCRQSFALFFDNFPRSRPATPETATLLRRPEKTRGFAPESVFTRERTNFRTVTLPSNQLMMGG